jgi:hypothetical protein
MVMARWCFMRCSFLLLLWPITFCLGQVPVRAVILPLLDQEAAQQLHSAVRKQLQELMSEDSIWWQDPTMLHATLYHASDYLVNDRAP